MAANLVIDITADDKASPELNRIVEKFDKIQNSTKPLSSKLSNIKKLMTEMAAAGKDNSPMYHRMAEAAAGYQRQLQGVNETIRRQIALQNEAGKGFDLKGMASQLGRSIGVDLGGIMSAIASPTGAIVAASGAAVAAGKALYEYGAELDRSMERVEQFTGLTGNALGSLRNGIKSVADTFGKDFDTVLASVDGMMAQFGMDGETALNIIRDGFVAGADDGGRMLEMISQYSGAFKDAGISASEMVAIIGNTRSGIFSEQGMALLQKGAQNIRLMSDTTSTALQGIGIDAEQMAEQLSTGQLSTVAAIQQVSTKLKSINPQSREAGEALRAVFGKQGAASGMELVTALADVNSNLNEVKKQSGEWGEAMQRVQESSRNLENAVSSLFGIANGGWAEMGAILKGELYQGLADVINYFIDMYNECEVLRYGIANIGTMFKTAWTIVSSILKLMFNGFKALSDVIQGIFSLDWKKVADGWNNGIKSLMTVVADGAQDIADTMAGAADSAHNGRINRITTESGSGETATNLGNGGGKTENPPKTTNPPKPTKPTYDAGSLADYEARLRAINDILQNRTLDDAQVMQYAKEAEALQKQIDLLKARNTLTNDRRIEGGQIAADITPAVNLKPGISAASEEMRTAMDDYAAKVREAREETRAILDGMGGDMGQMAGKFVDLGKVLKDDTLGATKQTAVALVTLGDSLQALGAEGAVAKAGAVLAAIGQIILGFSSASAQAGSLGPFGWLAFVGAGLAAVATTISTIKGFNEGGIVGGSAHYGDTMLARVNSGEMVLTRSQQSNLFNLLDGKTGGTRADDFKIVIKGSDLEISRKNYNSKMSKL